MRQDRDKAFRIPAFVLEFPSENRGLEEGLEPRGSHSNRPPGWFVWGFRGGGSADFRLLGYPLERRRKNIGTNVVE